MREIVFHQTGQTVLLPSGWDEMTPAQIREVFRIYYDCLENECSPLEFSIRVLYYLLGVKDYSSYLSLTVEDPAAAEKICENTYWLCHNCLGFLFTEDESPRLSYDSICNPLPTVRVKGLVLCGPADIIADLTFGEFRHAAASLNTFFQNQDLSDLHECIAHLYRRKAGRANKAGRKVVPVSQETFAKDVALVARLPMWKKGLIMMFFSNCVNYLQTGSLVIDGENVDFSKLYSGGSADSSAASFNWNDLLVQIARDGVIGNIDSVDEEPLMNILSIMWTNYKENKRNETRNSKTQ